MNSLFLVLFWPLNCGVWGSRCRRSAGSKGRKQMEDTYFFGWGWQYWGFIHEKFTFNGYHIYERRSHGICNRQPWSNDIWMNLITTSRRFLSLEWWLILDNTNPKWTYFSGGLIIHTYVYVWYIYIHTYIHIYISYPYMINIEILRNTIWHSIPFKWFNMYLWNATSKTWSVFRARGYCIPRSERSSIILKVSWSILAGETYGHLPWSDMLKY